MLLQSEGGRIRVFPACPNHWREIRFNNLRCEGSVEFSSARSNGRTLEIRLESASGDQVRLSTYSIVFADILTVGTFSQLTMASLPPILPLGGDVVGRNAGSQS